MRPLYSTAAGRVALAFADKRWQDEYIAKTKLEARTPRTVRTQKRLREELERVRKTKISVSIGEHFPESTAISAPVFGADGSFAAAIAIGGPTERVQPRIAELRPIIADIASRASGRRFTESDIEDVLPEPQPARKRGAAV